MKKIIYGTLFIILILVSVHNAYSGWGLFSSGNRALSFEKYYERVEKAYEKGVVFAEKHVYVKQNYFYMMRWKRFFQRWNDDLMNVKEGLRPYADEYPLVFDYFSIVLRDLHLLYLEYDGLFKGTKGTGLHMVDARKEEFKINMNNLSRELEFVTKKDTYLAEEYFYRKQ